MSETTRHIVEQYYRLVDAKALDEMLDLFADDAVYERPGYDRLEGRPAIEAFYRGERVIESGTHTLATVVVDGDRAAVEGSFAGVLRDGRNVEVRFADFYRLLQGRFVERHTYFFAPSV